MLISSEIIKRLGCKAALVHGALEEYVVKYSPYVDDDGYFDVDSSVIKEGLRITDYKFKKSLEELAAYNYIDVKVKGNSTKQGVTRAIKFLRIFFSEKVCHGESI